MSKKKNSDLSVVSILDEEEVMETESSDASGIIMMTEPDSMSRDSMDVIINSERNKIIDTMENEDLFSTDLAEEDDLLYDLNDTKPAAVKEVTVGDAEEYFNELGLEYNIDYKDSSVENSKNSKEKTRRSVEEVEPTDIEADDVAEEETEDSEEGLESNLFDLIESMYDEKE